MAQARAEGVESLVQPLQRTDALAVEGSRRHRQHRDVDHPGHAHRDDHVPALEAEDLLLLLLGRSDHSALGQRGVEVDHVRHHRRAQDAGAEEHALGAVEARHQKTGRDAAD